MAIDESVCAPIITKGIFRTMVLVWKESKLDILNEMKEI